MRQTAIDVYQKAQREARRFQTEHPQSAALPVLESFLADNLTELSLGVLEIPLKKIKGTYAAGRAPAFAGNFLPLLSPQSEFGQKWVDLCQSHLTTGIQEPIKVYEYLGYYYVVEGHKRVSVLRCFDAYSLHAHVTRLLPPFDPENAENAVFYELIGENRRAVIGHLWFSKPGIYPRLMEKAGRFSYGAALPDNWFHLCFFTFRQAYHTLEYPQWPMTTGDAFALYTDVYGFPYEEPQAVTTGHLRAMAPLLRHLAGLPALESRFVPPGASSLVVCFAFEGMPGTSAICRVHNAGRLALQRALPDITVKARFGLPPGDEAVADFEAIAAHKPHLLFAASPTHGRASLRAMLASKDTVVLHHSETPSFALLPVYQGMRASAAFLAGALAGSLTDTDVVGFGLPGYHEAYSFAHGARLVNPRARTVVPRTAFSPSDGEPNLIQKMTLEGADVAVLPRFPDTEASSPAFSYPHGGQPKGFLGAYGWLCALDTRLGCPSLYWGILGCRWDLFYIHTVRSFLAGDAIWQQAGRAPLTLPAGFAPADFFPIAIRMPAYTLRLLTLMRRCLREDQSLASFPEGQPPFFITVT